MDKLVEFGRMFLSYGLLVVICAAVIATAVTLGIFLAKRKNAKDEG